MEFLQVWCDMNINYHSLEFIIMREQSFGYYSNENERNEKD